MRRAILVALTVGFLGGCSKRDSGGEATSEGLQVRPQPLPHAATPAVVNMAEGLPGEDGIRASLAKREYDKAVRDLLALRGLATGARYTAYLTLYMEVVDALRQALAVDREAAKALNHLEAASKVLDSESVSQQASPKS